MVPRSDPPSGRLRRGRRPPSRSGWRRAASGALDAATGAFALAVVAGTALLWDPCLRDGLGCLALMVALRLWLVP